MLSLLWLFVLLSFLVILWVCLERSSKNPPPKKKFRLIERTYDTGKVEYTLQIWLYVQWWDYGDTYSTAQEAKGILDLLLKPIPKVIKEEVVE